MKAGVFMKQIFETFKIRNTEISNRICVPPMVCFGFSDHTGKVTEENIAHYRAIAQGHPGLVIQEATCVSEDGKLDENQLGIWSDEHIDGLKQIVDVVHKEGCPIILQIHHAGIISKTDQPLCPDNFQLESGIRGKKMDEDDIDRIRKAFIDAGIRAYKAGYEGVELHGCHKYLLCQFLNSDVNQRTDIYGKESEKYIVEIMEGIRRNTSNEFIIGIRLGAFEPTFEDGLRHAKILEQNGIDFINISYGFIGEHEPIKEVFVSLPEAFPFKDIIYAAGEFKKQLNIPVFAVNSIRTSEDAKKVIELTDVDMVNIGRSILVDPSWVEKVREGIEPGKCLGCRVCQWRFNYQNCPGLKMMLKS